MSSNRFLFLGVVLFLVFIRDPAYILSPGVWAEEGSIFIQSHLDNGFLGSLFAPHIGYYSILNNLFASASVELLGLKWVAYGTTLLSLTVMLLCIYAPVYLISPLWASGRVQMFMVVIALLLATPEIWLNTINLHFYLGLYGCYFLLSSPEQSSRKVRVLSLCLLLVAALNGVTTVLLLPLFLLRYLRLERRPLREKWILAIVVFGFLVQIAAFLAIKDTVDGTRLSWTNVSNLPMGLTRVLFYYAQGTSGTISAGIILFTSIGGLYYFLKYSDLRLLVLLILYVALVFSVLSLQMAGGGRYAFVPSVLTALFFINAWQKESAVLKKICTVFGILFIAYKIPFYFSTEDFYDPSWPSQAEAYDTAVEIQSNVIRIHPMWEGADWRIVTDEHLTVQ